jgi:ribosome-binding protein aMBF1 (putative translation factor)
MNYNNERLVEAIEEGKIVRVSENYARKEGPPILRKPKLVQIQETVPKIPEKRKSKDDEKLNQLSHDLSKRPLNWRKNQIFDELVENFHWQISKARKSLGLTRKQLADLINEKEETIKMLEYGTLTVNDFVLINKVQAILGINLRKDKLDINKSMHDMIKEGEPFHEKKIEEETLSGSEIEIFEDEEF